MILTHCGKFGDFVPSLVIPNYYYKKDKKKTTFILSSWFKNIIGLEEFLKKQDFVEKVIFDPYYPENFSYGAQPFKFKPESITTEQYYNLGIEGPLDDYLGVKYAQLYDLDYDLDIKLEFIDPDFPKELRGLNVYTHFYDDRWDKDMYSVRFTELLPQQGYVPLKPEDPLLHNLNLVYYSNSAIFYPNGFSVLADICGIKYNLINGSVNPKTYYINTGI